jgi:protein phosphatase
MTVGRFSFAVMSHPGSARPSNEDCVAAGSWIAENAVATRRALEGSLEKPFTCVVADGMGGHAAGERASRFAAGRITQLMARATRQQLAWAIRKANTELFARMKTDPGTAGMGTTIVGLCVDGTEASVFNVGDSRAYRVEAKGLRQLSIDDSSDPSWKPGSNFARSGFLTQCLGGNDRYTDVDPHMRTEPAEAGATYLLCTDGLYETLDEEQIRELITEDLAASTDALVRAALKHFAADNLTVALVRLD